MAITLRDFLAFPFNGGRGIRASQIADVDLPALDSSVDAIKTGALGFEWYFAIKQTQDFRGGDFRPVVGRAVASSFPELEIPTISADSTWFGAIAWPIDTALAHVNKGDFFSSDQIDRVYRRQLEPVWIPGSDSVLRPCRVWKGRHWLSTRDGGDELTFVPRPRYANYYRFADASVVAATSPNDPFTKSRTPQVALRDFGGLDRYLKVAVPEEQPDPTWISLATSGSANILGSFAKLGPIVIDTVACNLWVSDAPVDAATYSEGSLIILPERASVNYFEPPLVLDQADIGFTWYAGFYGYQITPFVHPANPVDAAVIQNVDHVVNGSTPQLTLPGGPFLNREYIPVPGANTRYVRFIAQPAAQHDVRGISDIRLPFLSYQSAVDFESGAVTSFTNNWRLQANEVDVGGTVYKVWLNRKSQNQHQNAMAGSTIYTIRESS